MTNCMIAGVGGQGTILASKLLAAAAMEAGLNVRTTETIGMAQRGGSVVSHVRMGDVIHSPLIPLHSAQLLIAFEPAEAVRLTPYLAEDGLLIVCDTAIKPATAAMGGSYEASVMTDFLKQRSYNAVILNGQELTAQCGTKALNIALLGAAVQSNRLPFNAELLEKIIQTKIPEKFLKMNLDAFSAGKKMYYEP